MRLFALDLQHRPSCLWCALKDISDEGGTVNNPKKNTLLLNVDWFLGGGMLNSFFTTYERVAAGSLFKAYLKVFRIFFSKVNVCLKTVFKWDDHFRVNVNLRGNFFTSIWLMGQVQKDITPEYSDIPLHIKKSERFRRISIWRKKTWPWWEGWHTQCVFQKIPV